MKKSKRVKLICDFIGETKQLKNNVIPTNDKVLRYYIFIYGCLKKNSKNDPFSRDIILEE